MYLSSSKIVLLYDCYLFSTLLLSVILIPLTTLYDYFELSKCIEI